VPSTQAILASAPVLADYTSSDTRSHFEALQTLLRDAGIVFTVNPRLVRGLDYYNNMVFEWITEALGAQGTVCAGGRYDGLVSQLGGRGTPAVGFAMGVERLVLLLQETAALPSGIGQELDVFIAVGDGFGPQAMALAETLRDRLPSLRIQLNCGGGKVSNQLKKAFNAGAGLVLVVEASEQGLAQVKVRRLADDSPALIFRCEDVADGLQRLISGA
jgi:histidyl-tRNA synthetase